MPRTVYPGASRPLGALFDGQGTNFALFSASASQVVLCLFDDAGTEEQILLHAVDAFVWHCYLPGVNPGQRYGFRVDGEWNPDAGLRSNPAKLLLDPYALAVEGGLSWGSTDADAQRLFDYSRTDFSRDENDSASALPKCVVVDRDSFDWGTPEIRPSYALADTVIYESHVRGMTMRHPTVPAGKRGSYAALTHPDLLAYLRDLEVTTVELMPVQQFFVDRDDVNFFGYQPAAFLAPHAAYSAAGIRGQQVDEFKTMVKTLHENGLEVILDVVFNHTYEGGNDPLQPVRTGPTVGPRGIDNRSYYLLANGDPRTYINDSGVGNTLNVWDPSALQLVMDALRYWANEMHVDGFRFDLAGVLAQTDPTHSVSVFLHEISQDPVIGGLKLIAEPWSGGGNPSEYLLGRFPPLWCQWNGDFHWDVRDFWKSSGNAGAMARGMLGSPSLFQAGNGEQPTASINFAACHDGSTIRDAVSFNIDGQHAWNCITPGQIDGDPQVTALRSRMQRNMLATTVLAQGVPMILYGDECGRTQGGDANAYNIDSETTWMPWGADQDADLLAFTHKLVRLRRHHPAFRRPRFFQQDLGGAAFFLADGTEVTSDALNASSGACAFAFYLNGAADLGTDPTGQTIHDGSSFLLLMNADWNAVDFSLPGALAGSPWEAVLVTETADGSFANASVMGTVSRPGRSLMVLSQASGAPASQA